MDLEPFVEQEQVGPFARLEASAVCGDSGPFGRSQGRHADDLPERDLGDFRHVTHAVVQGDDGACESPGRAESNLARAFNPNVFFRMPKGVFAWGHVQGSARIAHEAEHRRFFHLPCELEEFGCKMVSVGDDFGAHRRVSQNEFEHAALHGGSKTGADRGDRGHRAPEVIDVGHSAFVGSGHLAPA